MTSGPLVVSLLGQSVEAFEGALASGAAASADVVEFRIDHVARDVVRDPSLAEGLLQAAGRPVIVALHGSEGFGSFDGSVSERAAALLAWAEVGARWIDVDARFAKEVGRALEGVDCGRIISTHAVAPERAALDRSARELDALGRDGRDLVKLVPACGSAEDAFEVLEWLSRRPPNSTIAFGSGACASFTRAWAPAFGSVFVYAAVSPEVRGLLPAAPGQVGANVLRRIWPGRAPDRGTKLAAVVGRPIGHSASPVVHGAAARVRELDAVLVAIAPESVDSMFRYENVARRVVGLSVTAPFKADAYSWAKVADEATKRMGAANTILADGGRASNTDAPGIASALRECGVAGDRARTAAGRCGEDATGLVVGAGGAARAAAFALSALGLGVAVAARRLARAEAVAGTVGGAGYALDDPELVKLRPVAIVHTTPLGTGGKGVAPVLDEHLRPGVAVLDAVYEPRRTALLERAEARGATPISGAHWFLGQARRQHEILFGEFESPDCERRAAAAMATALDDWLGERTGPPIAALVGLRCSGKSSVGRELARIAGSVWIDLDEEIARRESVRGVAEIIERRGLAAFREVEAHVAVDVLNVAEERWRKGGTRTVVSTGGGVVESDRVRGLLVANTFAAWLDPPLEVLRDRFATSGGPKVRPPITGDGACEFATLHASRSADYTAVASVRVRVRERDSVAALARLVSFAWNEARVDSSRAHASNVEPTVLYCD